MANGTDTGPYQSLVRTTREFPVIADNRLYRTLITPISSKGGVSSYLRHAVSACLHTFQASSKASYLDVRAPLSDLSRRSRSQANKGMRDFSSDRQFNPEAIARLASISRK